MRSSLIVLFLFASALCCVAQTPADPQYEGSIGPLYYSGGYVLEWDSPEYTHVTVYGLDAKPIFSNPLRVPEDWRYTVWAIDSDGVAARAAEPYKGSNFIAKSAHIDLLDATGKILNTIKTGSYEPQHIVFAPDHSFWTVGVDGDYSQTDVEFDVLRHYSRNGEELGHGLPWSQIAGDFNARNALQLCLGAELLYMGTDRIGFQARLKYDQATWVEVGTAGNLLGTYDLGRFRELDYYPSAMTARGSVYARIYKYDKPDGWAVLDRSTKTWRKVKGYPKGVIIGADGENLIFSEHDTAWTVLHSVPTASLHLEPLTQQTAMAAAQE